MSALPVNDNDINRYQYKALSFTGVSQLRNMQESLRMSDRTNLPTLSMHVEGISSKRASSHQTKAYYVHHRPGCHSGLFKAPQPRRMSDCHWQPPLAALLLQKNRGTVERPQSITSEVRQLSCSPQPNQDSLEAPSLCSHK